MVCTGNICRSPMAEHILREGLRARLGEEADEFVVASAGTFGLTDHAMEPNAHDQLVARGWDGSRFRAQELKDFMVQGADLVLTATREHRAAAVTLAPQTTRKTFTIREFDRLLSTLDPETLPTYDRNVRGHAIVAAAASQRGLIRPEKPGDDDINDPYRGPVAGYVACAELLDASFARPLDLLAG
jgi:protein-tyrosine phosphatase